MNLKSLVIAPVLLSMIACSKDKVTNSPNSQDKVALELSAVKAENLENQLDSLQRIIFSGNMETTEVVYKALQKLEVSYPDDSRIKFYLKLIKPMLLAKGIHRKMDHLVYMAEGDAGLWDHINDLRKRSDARFLRNAKKEEVFKTEKQAQELVDKIADSYGDLFQFAKKIESSSVELLMPQSKCDNEYYTVAYWKYDDELEYGRDYFVRGFKKGYGYKKSSESSDKGEWFYSDTKESILSKISRYEAKLTEIEGEIENAEEGVELDRLEDNLKYYKKELANAQAMLNREEGEYLTDRVYQSGVCVSSSYKYKMEKLDWKYIQAAATGLRLYLSTTNAYDLRGGAVLTGMTNYWNSKKINISEKSVQDHLAQGNTETDKTYEFLGKLRKENRLDLYTQTTSDIVAGAQWILDNDQITCTDKFKERFGDGVCTREEPNARVNTNDQIIVFGSVVNSTLTPVDSYTNLDPEFAKQDILDNLVKGFTSARTTQFDVGGESYMKFFDARQFFLNPMEDISVLLGQEFNEDGFRTGLADPTLNGMFPNGDIKDMLNKYADDKSLELSTSEK